MDEPVKIVRIVKRIEAQYTVEDAADYMGGMDIWVRHPEEPQFDEKLVSVHYSYAYMDNGRKRSVANAIADLLNGASG